MWVHYFHFLLLLSTLIQTQVNSVADSQSRLPILRACLSYLGTNGADSPNSRLFERNWDPSSRYAAVLNHQWNLRVPKVYPVAYFVPSCTEDVSYIIRCGSNAGIHVVANSGGHSYEPVSFGNNETIIVDFRDMKGIAIRQGEGGKNTATVSIEPGALLGHVNAYLWENGRYFSPLGNCMTVGLGGHVIGGGVGYWANTYGLALDNVLEFEMVTAQGNIVTASATRNPDLFWALRGVGPGFIGIVTRLTQRLYDADPLKLTMVTARYKLPYFLEVWDAYQNFLKWMEKEEPSVFSVWFFSSDSYNGKFPPLPPGLEVHLFHIQDPVYQPRSNARFLSKFSELFPPGGQTSITNPNYIETVIQTGYVPVRIPTQTKSGHPTYYDVGRLKDPQLFAQAGSQKAEPPTVDQTLQSFKSLSKEMAAERYFKAKSFFIKDYFSSKDARVKKLNTVLQRIPDKNVWMLVNTEGGRIWKTGSTDTAYVHRNSLLDFVMHYEGSAEPADVDEGMSWIREFWDAIQFMDGGETYQNHPDYEVTDLHERIYGENLDRLIQAKCKLDPSNYFKTRISLKPICEA